MRPVETEFARSGDVDIGGVEVDTAGDGFLATFDGPARAVRCACAIRDAVSNLGIQIRAGLHSGESSAETARSPVWRSTSRASLHWPERARFW